MRSIEKRGSTGIETSKVREVRKRTGPYTQNQATKYMESESDSNCADTFLPHCPEYSTGPDESSSRAKRIGKTFYDGSSTRRILIFTLRGFPASG